MTKLTGIIASESKLEGNLGVRNEINVSITGTGPRGLQGSDGYTPVKGVDYFDGIDGKDGKDGHTPIKGVDYFDGSDANVTKTNVVNALGYIPLSEDSLPSNLETTTGSQAKATQALNSAKSYVDDKVLIDVPANAKFTDTTYGVATASTNGLMSATDKQNVDSNTGARHTHTNKVVIDKFSDVGGKPFYNGEEIAGAELTALNAAEVARLF